jgi:hypothetical protein
VRSQPPAQHHQLKQPVQLDGGGHFWWETTCRRRIVWVCQLHGPSRQSCSPVALRWLPQAHRPTSIQRPWDPTRSREKPEESDQTQAMMCYCGTDVGVMRILKHTAAVAPTDDLGPSAPRARAQRVVIWIRMWAWHGLTCIYKLKDRSRLGMSICDTMWHLSYPQPQWLHALGDKYRS